MKNRHFLTIRMESVLEPLSALLVAFPRSDWKTSPETNLSVFGGIFSRQIRFSLVGCQFS